MFTLLFSYPAVDLDWRHMISSKRIVSDTYQCVTPPSPYKGQFPHNGILQRSGILRNNRSLSCNFIFNSNNQIFARRKTPLCMRKFTFRTNFACRLTVHFVSYTSNFLSMTLRDISFPILIYYYLNVFPNRLIC